MKIAIVGAGPAGLYLSYLIKRRDPRSEVRVFEQQPPNATFGFGVVFSDRALEFLRADDPGTYDAILPAMQSWSDMALDLEGRVIPIDGVGFSAIGRLELLQILQTRTRAAGVEVEYEHAINSPEALRGADLIVGADGVNSVVRRTYEKEFGASVDFLNNRFAWYGTTRRFETLTQTFRSNQHGAFTAHHYRYAPNMSTFIVETDATTWEAGNFESMEAEPTRHYLQEVFADVLDGHPLATNKSIWRRFPKVKNERFAAGNAVLLGDALHTAHFSIGSGTRLAMEDVIALERAIARHPSDAQTAVKAYEAERRPVLDKLTKAADASANWYEQFAQHMKLPPMEFAMSYITRSERVDLERLCRISPRFVAAYEAAVESS